MNTTPQFHFHRNAAPCEPGFDALEQPDNLVEHLTVPGFLARVPRQWQIDEATRYGHQLGRAAEAMHLAYMTTTDPALGVLRVFPVPLMRRVYVLMRHQFNWPELPEVLRPVSAAGKGDDRLAMHLQALHTVAEGTVRDHIAAVLEFLDQRRQ